MSYINQATQTTAALKTLFQVTYPNEPTLASTALLELDDHTEYEVYRHIIYKKLTGKKAPALVTAKKLFHEFAHRMNVTGNSFEEKIAEFDRLSREYLETSTHTGYEPLEVQ